MEYNGSSELNSPVWSMVSGLHNLIIYGVLIFVVGALVLFVMIHVLFVFLPKPKSKKETLIEPITEEFQTQPDQEQIKLKAEAEHKQIKEQQKIEEQRKQEVIKRKREWSADAAAHDALDDFL